MVLLAAALFLVPHLTGSFADNNNNSASGTVTPDVTGGGAEDALTSGAAVATAAQGTITSYRILSDPSQEVVSKRTLLQLSRDGGLHFADVAKRPGGETPLIAVGWDSAHPERVAVTTADLVYLSEDAGTTWREIVVKDQINRNVKLTAVALSPYDKNHMLLGTSFDGFYESADGGAKWDQISNAKPLEFFSRGAGFTEEVSSISYDPNDAESIDFTLGFGYGSYRYNIRAKSVVRLDSGPMPSYSEKPVAVDNTIETSKDSPGVSAAVARRVEARDRTGIYVSPVNARKDRIGEYLALAKKEGFNSIVVDFKDDFGYLRYASDNAIAKATGAVRPLFDAKNLVEQAHAAGVYVIARMVVFKDEQLYGYQNHKYALWDTKRNAPWGVFREEQVPVAETTQPAANANGSATTGSTAAASSGSASTAGGDSTGADTKPQTVSKSVQVEYWVDPYSQFVWDYNAALAKEIQDLGVDEIQFDYIRFPSDGDTASIQARFKPDGMDRVQALSSFLKRAREELNVPISIDVYGFNAWYRTNYLGQDVEELSRYVDVICPMFYPSHFTRSFYGAMSYLDRAKFIYREGSNRAQAIVATRSIIRPWVQSFLIGGELKFDTSTYTQYLIDQLEGAQEGSASGFTLWNASGRYYMITGPLNAYTAGN